MPIDLEARRRARSRIALVAGIALLVAAIMPKLQGQSFNRVMLSLAVVFLALAGAARRRVR